MRVGGRGSAWLKCKNILFNNFVTESPTKLHAFRTDEGTDFLAGTVLSNVEPSISGGLTNYELNVMVNPDLVI